MADTVNEAGSEDGETRRDFLHLTAVAVGAVGAGFAVWPLISSMNPSAEVLALAEVEVDISPIEVGQAITVTWQGKPVFIRHRTPEEISAADAVDIADLPDPETDADRTEKQDWLVIVGICTHLGCIPKGQKAGEPKGQYDGYFCPCHGSHYDTSGRIRKGPAPKNLLVPPYEFVDDTTVKIG
ncbi:MAG: ubiquinol-cytochrome c reductase iron-sulfur subunit [Kiloniellales bacterium]|nr:ubiquinol-cytochrome c reductase iron-sulfur subunit [Kiloniellales bacterium]